MQQPLPTWENSFPVQSNHFEQSGAAKSGRKQHRSCDQCRKGKRGCDAVIPKDITSSPGSLRSDSAGYPGGGSIVLSFSDYLILSLPLF
jgi:hypothetical protein